MKQIFSWNWYPVSSISSHRQTFLVSLKGVIVKSTETETSRYQNSYHPNCMWPTTRHEEREGLNTMYTHPTIYTNMSLKIINHLCVGLKYLSALSNTVWTVGNCVSLVYSNATKKYKYCSINVFKIVYTVREITHSNVFNNALQHYLLVLGQGLYN